MIRDPLEDSSRKYIEKNFWRVKGNLSVGASPVVIAFTVRTSRYIWRLIIGGVRYVRRVLLSLLFWTVLTVYLWFAYYCEGSIINPLSMCSRVTVVCLCVCLCVCYRSICFTAELYFINV